MSKNNKFIRLILFAFVFTVGLVFEGYFMRFSACSFLKNYDGVIRVPSNYSNITEAIEHAIDGDTIIIDAGLYNEFGIVVDKRVRIVGVNRSGVVIDGGGVNGPIIIIRSSGVILENLTLRNTYLMGEGASAVTIYNVGGVMVKNVLLSNVAVGVHVRDSNYSSIMYCNFSGISICGIKISGISCNNTLVGNNFWDLPNKAIIIASSSSLFTRLYHNNFFNSSVPSPPATTFFDNGYPSGGNFWSDHISVDFKHGPRQDEDGGDGIVDSGYPVDSPRDYYPLMFPIVKIDVLTQWGVFEVFASLNATIVAYNFNASDKILALCVESVQGGFVSFRLSIPKVLLSCYSSDEWHVLRDGEDLPYLVFQDDRFTYFYIVYTQTVSQNTIAFKGTTAVPEFSMPLLFAIILIFSAVFILKIVHKYCVC
ncbi:MAG: right-handed parallel beta-helix repeat-containing protein [Candidatus Bathyarchaeia archaeon]